MIRIEGVPVVAEGLQEVSGSACQAVPRQGTTTADSSARDEFQTGVNRDPGTIIQRSSDTTCGLRGRIASMSSSCPSVSSLEA
jgi:hypothetical protein